MRLWTLHPQYLDARGLVALWREALLAQAVLLDKTRGYRNHPQLARFRAAPQPATAIAAYLNAVHAEARRRGYHFDASKIGPQPRAPESMAASSGQLAYEWQHLRAKLQQRAPELFASALIQDTPEPLVHPLFHRVPGPVAEWEVIQPAAKNTVRRR